MFSKKELHYVVILLICLTLLYLLFRVLMKGKSLKKRVTTKDMKWKCIVGTIRYVFLYSFLMLFWSILLSTNQKFCKWFYCYNLRSEGSKKSVPFLKMKVVLLKNNIGSLLISPFLRSLCRNCLGFESYILMLCSKNPSLLLMYSDSNEFYFLVHNFFGLYSPLSIIQVL